MASGMYCAYEVTFYQGTVAPPVRLSFSAYTPNQQSFEILLFGGSVLDMITSLESQGVPNLKCAYLNNVYSQPLVPIRLCELMLRSNDFKRQIRKSIQLKFDDHQKTDYVSHHSVDGETQSEPCITIS
jgi:hypothetical protein